MNQWKKETEQFDNYYPIVVKLDRYPAGDLMAILDSRCSEQVVYQDVLQVADRICQDIGKELTATMKLRGDMTSVAVFRVNSLDEGLIYLGPLDDANYSLFLDGGIMMTRGYNAYMRSRGENG